MIVVERLIALMREKGISQAELARQVGISQQAIGKLVHGLSRSSPHIGQIATVLGTTPAYLLGQTDDPREGATLLPTPEAIVEHLDLVPIVRINLSYGMGGTNADLPIEELVEHFPRAWIEAITKSPPELLYFAKGRGDSMLPTLYDGDLILIDRSQRSVREQDAIWALTIGDIAMIKRLRVRGETVTIKSDNKDVDDDTAHPDEVNIVGRVIFIGRRV